MITIRRIGLGEGEIFKQLRLESLSESPEFFGTTFEDALARSDESWHWQADNSAQGSDRATFLAFSDEEPIGIAALYRDHGEKTNVALIQVWVRPAHRRRNVAGKLLNEIFDWAKTNEFARIYAWVVKDNKRMLRTLSNFGFEIAGEEKSFRDAIVSCQLIKKAE